MELLTERLSTMVSVAIGARGMDFGRLLSRLMTEHGLGVRALARRVPCDPALISRLAAGRQQPSAQLARKLDALAVGYASTPPQELLSRASTYLEYATGLLGGRVTLGEHRRLLVTSGWLSLLTATSLIDLRRQDAAAVYLATAAQMAGEAEHKELAAWCLETRAWQALTTRDYPRAAAFARDAGAPKRRSPS